MSGKPEEYQNGWCTLNSRGLTHPPWTQTAGQSQEQSRTKEPPRSTCPARSGGQPGVLLSLTPHAGPWPSFYCSSWSGFLTVEFLLQNCKPRPSAQVPR